jgi:hypothetical protein
VTSTFDDWVATLGGSVSPEARAFLRHVFDEHGPVSSEEAGRLGHQHQLALTREAVALVARDIATTTTVDPPPFEFRDEDGSIHLAFWGQYATTPISGLNQAAVSVEVADFMQGEVMEDLHGIWPKCREHAVGMHPSLSSERAVWMCRTGVHAVAQIGQLRAQSA